MSSNVRRTFVAGKMNKSVDERLLPPGEYVDARNVRLGSTEQSEIGAVENSKGNTRLTTLRYAGSDLSASAICIGAYEDGVNETIYWFVHDPAHPTGNVDMVVSYNTNTTLITYHVITVSLLNFNPLNLITGVDLIEDLLFFTDDLNPPRCINVKRNYDYPVAGVDAIIEDDLNVIKKPPGFEAPVGGVYPLAAPGITPQSVPGDENYIVDKFVTFAYRYRYKDSEYSATSLFTQPAFEPFNFSFSTDNFNNEGMQNRHNAYAVSFNTGDERVIGIDVLFKLTNSNSIFVIERYVKQDEGWPDDDVKTIVFSNEKLYTVLASDEILRLYDNVPLKAKSQTIQGNRLIYGNYLEGYNIERPKGVPLKIDYSVGQENISVAGEDLPPITFSNTGQQTYNINPTTPTNVADAQIEVDLTGIPVPILPGTTIFFEFELESSSAVAVQGSGPNFSGAVTSFQTAGGVGFDLSATFVANVQYNSIAALVNSPEFQEILGVSGFQPIASAANGFTLTDNFNAFISPPTGFAFINSGITGNCGDPTVVLDCVQGGFGFQATANGFLLQVPAVQYSDAGSGGTSDVWEYFEFNAFQSNVGFLKVPNTLSLHSNRDYQVGIVYMDDFGRASTVLTSDTNTLFIDPDKSVQKNRAVVTLNNLPPFWATKYKFVVKPSSGTYETVYTNLIYIDSNDQTLLYCQLQGDNINKVKTGDNLIVKVDVNGAVITETKVKVLDVKVFASGDVPGATASGVTSPPGVYMIIKSGSFVATVPAGSNVFDYGLQDNSSTSETCNPTSAAVSYSLNTTSDINGPTPIDVPAGSKVRIYIDNWRGSKGANCTKKQVKFNKEFIASQDYANIYDFIQGDNIQITTSEASIVNGVSLAYYNNGGVGPFPNPGAGPSSACFGSRVFIVDNGFGGQYLRMWSGIPRCGPGWDKRPGHAGFRLQVTQASGLVIFETEAGEVDPNLYYDTNRLYNIVGGFHLGGPGDTNQSAVNPSAVITLDNADCFTFGNGVESYKIFDDLDGMPFYLGERTLAVSKQDYAEARRFAGLTYSGVFTPGANSNNLNEFNLGLINFKDLETSFGPIMKLHSRETDILVLQEDRISYVLSGKNVVTDSTGGGAIASVPEVLGTQIARIEEYGITQNPESFASWGNKIFFTDVKRGAVLMLQGASANSDQLQVISEYGMRSWFRDQFIDQSNTQKLGGYDPYMDEYVLSTNNEPIVTQSNQVECGSEVEIIKTTQSYSYQVELGAAIGDFNVSYDITTGDAEVTVTWDTATSSINTTTDPTSGTITINKSSSSPTFATVTILPLGSDTITHITTVECVEVSTITVVQIVLNTGESNGKFIHYGYNWSDSNTTSPSTSELASLQAVQPAEYLSNTGFRSVNVFPYNGADVTMRVTKLPGDDFIFNPAINKFKHLSSNNLYTSSTADINTLLGLATTVPLPYTATSPGNVSVQIPAVDIPLPNANQYLYLIWDLRNVAQMDLCYSDVGPSDACCGCNETCGVAFFGPNTPLEFQVCATDTTNNGAAQNSFHGSGVIPTIGDACFTGLGCDVTNPLATGYYVVSQTQPATLPKQWIYVNDFGIVEETGTC